MLRLRVLAFVLLFGLVVAACTSDGDDQPPATGTTGGSQLTAIMASVDLYASDPQRVSIGLVTADNHLVSFGTVDLAFSMVGSAEDPTAPQPGPTATATFVPTFGTPDRSGGPVVTNPNEGRGVYEAEGVVFDQPGFWVADVTANVEGMGRQTAQASFAVTPEPGLPAPGDRAMKTQNLTTTSRSVPLSAIDSRAGNTGTIPDPKLHRWTIAQAVDQGLPALVVFATPVFCISRFCGPVVNMVENLEHRYADRAVFIHVEIWKDYDKQVLNDAPKQWLTMPNGDLTEPWLFLIGADGTIQDRWSSMWSEQEVADELEALPPMRG